MEEKRMNEQESLALISEMIELTKEKMEVGAGNLFLLYGSTATALSVLVYLLVENTQNHSWSSLWFLMFLPQLVVSYINRNKKESVVSYTDKAVNSVWQVVGGLFVLSVVVLFALLMFVGKVNFAVMMPLSLIYAGVGTSVTGVLLREKCLVYTPCVAFVLAVYMVNAYVVGSAYEVSWQLLFGLAFLCMMVVPGCILNAKSKRKCSKN